MENDCENAKLPCLWWVSEDHWRNGKDDAEMGKNGSRGYKGKMIDDADAKLFSTSES